MKPHQLYSSAAMLLLVGMNCVAGALEDATSLRMELAPTICRLLELERNLLAKIDATGKNRQQFLSKSLDDNDPNVIAINQVIKEIEAVAAESRVNFERLKSAVGTLSDQDKVKIKDLDRQLLRQCRI
jgi:hypothetical protein